MPPSRKRSIIWSVVAGSIVLAGGFQFFRLSGRLQSVQIQQSTAQAGKEAALSLEAQIQEAFRAAFRLAEAPDLTASASNRDSRFDWRLFVLDGSLVTDGRTQLTPAAQQSIMNRLADKKSNGQPDASGPYRARDGSLLLLIRIPIWEGGLWRWFGAAMPMDALLGSSDLRNLAAQGYDFELNAIDPISRNMRILTRSTELGLNSPVRIPIPQTNRHWTLSVSPKPDLQTTRGWMSALLVGLFSLIAALLAYDASAASRRLKQEIHLRSARLKAVGRRLMDEKQQRFGIEKQFQHAGFHDALTGLPNRGYFLNRLDRALHRLRRQPGSLVAVLLVNLDRFKTINESLGYAAGDELIVSVVLRLENCFRPSDLTVARMGGDEFAVLLFDLTDLEVPAAAAVRIQDALSKPFTVHEQTLFLTAGVGVAASSTGFETADEIMRAADIALSKAKAEGRSRFAIFNPQSRDQIVALKLLETGLHQALDRQEFGLLFQPIVSLETGRIAGLEALIRWNHPLEGVIPPAKFITLAEETGLIVPITRWILTEVCQQASRWRMRLPADIDFYLSANLSAQDLREPDLCDFIAGLLRQFPLPPGTLRLEVTESMMIGNVKAASELVSGLRSMGIPLLLDDFGTGYSSLSYLNRFRFDYLKIDRSFVSAAGKDQNEGILKAIVHLARNLGIQTIVEGVENAGVMRRMRELRCDFGQGYHFARPMPSPQAEELLKARTRWTLPPSAGHAASASLW